MKNKPVILLLELVGKKYLYDRNTNQVFCINENLYNEIVDYINGYHECIENNLSDELKLLISKGILSNNKLEQIEHPMTEYIEDILDNYVNSITLQVTQNCNMKCRYCSYSGDGILDRKRNTNSMSVETAKKAIDFLYDKSNENEHVTIAFYGGEPLIKYNLIKEIVDYSNKKFIGKKITYAITTNGTIINDEIIELLSKNNFNTTISLDGVKDTHNRNRRMLYDGRGSYDTIIGNLNYIKNKALEYYKKIIINSVIERDSSIDDTITFFSKDELLNENNIVLNEVYDGRINLSYPKTDEFLESKELFILNNLLKTYVFNKKTNTSIAELSDINKVEKSLLNTIELSGKKHPAGVCIPGLKKMIIDYKGDIRICEKVDELSSDFIIGNIEKGFDFENIKRLLNIGQMTFKTCFDCWAFNFCTQCVATISDLGELKTANKLKVCNNTKKQVMEKLKNYIIIKEIQNL